MSDVARPPFDPRQRFAVELHDLGPRTAWRPDERGELRPREERSLAMDVLIDNECEIVCGLVLEASDTRVAFNECGMCGEWGCNLVEGWSAKVARLGPYVFWMHYGDRLFTFDADEYAKALGGSVEEVPPLEDAYDLDEPDLEAAYAAHDGSVLDLRDERGLLAALSRASTMREGALRAVPPPSEAVEVRALNGLSASAWIDARPRESGRRAAYLPAVTWARVWFEGDEVDRVVEALTGAR